MFKAEWRLFWKQKKLWIPYLIYFVGSIIWAIRVSSTWEFSSVDSMLHMIELDKYSFLFFLILSYFYFSKNNPSGIHEVITASGNELFYIAMLRIVVLQILNIALTSSMISISLFLSIQENISGQDYYLYIIQLWILYHGLPCLLASLFGLCLSKFRNKRLEYAGVILTSFIFAGTFPLFLQMISEKTDIIYRFADVFCIFARGTRRAVNYYYLIPVETNNYFRAITWCTICILICTLGIKKNSGKILSVILSLVTLCTFFVYIQPSGNAYFDDMITNHDEWTADQSYYRNTPTLEEAPGFTVAGYTMEFKVRRQLSAKVTMQVDTNNLEQYIFTLYHGYKIESVSDGAGNELSYDRNGDYLTVWNEKEQLDKICISYTGFSRNFYSTSQGVLLPAYFAYYPIPGYCPVFISQQDEEWVEEYTRNSRTYANYHVIIDAPEEIYCSLPSGKDNKFEGCSEGVTLIGGHFMGCFSTDNYRIIYPSLQYKEADIEAMYLAALKDSEALLQGRDIIIVPYTMYQYLYYDDTQLLTFGWTLETDLEEIGEYYDYN